eukprot:Opistho-2@17323
MRVQARADRPAAGGAAQQGMDIQRLLEQLLQQGAADQAGGTGDPDRVGDVAHADIVGPKPGGGSSTVSPCWGTRTGQPNSSWMRLRRASLAAGSPCTTKTWRGGLRAKPRSQAIRPSASAWPEKPCRWLTSAFTGT